MRQGKLELRKVKKQQGVTLFEVTIALSILAIAVLGSMSLLMALQTDNQAADDSRKAHKACQEVMEQLLAMDYNTMIGQSGVTFYALDINPNQTIGNITIADISPTGTDDLHQITVSIINDDSTVKPINVSLVSIRTKQ